MKRYIILPLLLLLPGLMASAQTYEDGYERSLSDVLNDVQKRFGLRLKYDVDTTGLRLKYADFRIRPYSVDETLTNILAPFDFRPQKQREKYYKIKPYEYPRRTAADGEKLIPYLASLYNNKEEWEARRDTLRSEVRERLGIDPLLQACSDEAPQMGKKRRHDGYTVQNFRLKTTAGHTVCGSIYEPAKAKGKKPLIICPNGHFANGRYNDDLQRRYATLARMGAVCVSYDLWGWGESADEVGAEAHHSSEAHVMQALNGVRILDFMLQRKDIDLARVAVNGGSGGGTQAVLLTAIDDRYTAACPVVSMSSWFDGGCPCESGKPIQLSAGGTCNPEIAAMFAPRPMMVVSDGGDWTSTTPEMEYPYLQRIYAFYDAEDKVMNVHLPNERHDFGPNKRAAVYDFFIQVFNLDRAMLDEDKVTVEDEETLKMKNEEK